MSDANTDSGIEEKLDIIIRLLALQLVATKNTKWEQALLLDAAGLSNWEIARVCDSSSDIIDNVIVRAKKNCKR